MGWLGWRIWISGLGLERKMGGKGVGVEVEAEVYELEKAYRQWNGESCYNIFILPLSGVQTEF